jgi:nitrogen fixation/metabolism regulation signal transduction histidine kinase
VYKERKALLRKNENQAEIERTIYLEEALNTLLSSESNKIMATASQIYTEARNKTSALQRQGNWVITLFSFLLIFVIGITTLQIAKVINMQLTILKKSADNIGAGDLYTVVPDLGGDEFGDLSNAFESMRLSRQQTEEALQKAHNELESRVQERTAELESINERMKGEIEERKKAEEEKEKLITDLQTAFVEVKTLRGILPLCSHCKKIRDDKGYWEKVDVYIYKHSQADISHSICPDCAKEHYPDFDISD